jgi:glycosyltransferase involved in cell wall biosynthesis
LKIAILGTRGIPNNYGGPEANAEFMAPILVRLGHEVTVYSPDEHPYQERAWNGVKLRHVYNQESRLGIWGTLLYDFLCLRDAMRSDFDIILELGYVPVAIFFPLRGKSRARLVTNMDGLEWKRSKWNFVLQRFALLTEMLGARCSDALIADNEAIKDYLFAKYGKHSYFIPYGAKPVAEPAVGHLDAYRLQPGAYSMLIARMEPENNVEMVLDGYVASRDARPFLVVGKTTTRFGEAMVRKFAAHERVRFLGGIYDYDVLSALRRHAAFYFHGHSVGGTNPSLVEAMATGAFVAAHDNAFNRSVLEGNALYFADVEGVASVLQTDTSGTRARFEAENRRKVRDVYDWEKVAAEHVRVFGEILARG